MIAGLDTLLTALYVELTDRIIPVRGFTRRGPGGRPKVTDAELTCIAVAQVLLRFDDERHWLRIAPRLIGHLFPRLLRQPEYNTRLRAAAPLMEAALRWLADATPATAEMLRLMDATPVPCGPVCYGPNVVDAATLLASMDVIGVERAADLMGALLMAPVSTGFVSRCLVRLDAVLTAAAFEDALKDALRASDVPGTDQTPPR